LPLIPVVTVAVAGGRAAILLASLHPKNLGRAMTE
jgi:hypothetical protein